MNRTDFNYELPEYLIAQYPIEKRELSKLMVLEKDTGMIVHKNFIDILDYLNEGDCLVLNDTRVIPARLLGEKETTKGSIEFVLLNDKGNDVWEVLTRPGKKAKKGAKFTFGNGKLKAEVVDLVEDGNRLMKFFHEGIFEEILDEVGLLPLPPYIKQKLEQNERYQTVYSKNRGSAAAPTAGLHFTNELLDKIKQKGVNIAYITLHVGLGTFRPMKSDNVKDHKMHSEYFELKEQYAKVINRAKANKKNIIAVGTTSCRVLETLGSANGFVNTGAGWTNIFIYPGYNFKVVDRLITNFHLPESTLIMLVSALAGKEETFDAYSEAVKQSYRFFSFGDAMFIK